MASSGSEMCFIFFVYFVYFVVKVFVVNPP